MNQYDYDSHEVSFEMRQNRIFCHSPACCYWHSDMEFYTVLSGTLDCLIQGQAVRLSAGESVFINCGTLHMVSNTGCPLVEVVRCRLPICVRADWRLPGQALPAFMVFAPAEEVSMLLHQLYGLFQDGAQDMGCCTKLAKQILFHIEQERPNRTAVFFPSKSDSRQAETAKEILEYIHTHFQEKISIQALSRTLYIGQSGFFRCFKRFTNTTPVQYLNSLRLMKAETLLCNSQNSIYEISKTCGFYSTGYFGRMFKKQYQLSPMQYRKRSCPSNSRAIHI